MEPDSFIIWAAGFFDGEGGVTIPGPPSYGLHVAITGTHRPTLEKEFAQRYPGTLGICAKKGRPIGKSGYSVRQTCYSFTFTFWGAREFLPLILPYLRVRREEAQLALDYISSVLSLASLRGGFGTGSGRRLTGIERAVRRQFYLRLKTLRDSSPPPSVEPQPELLPTQEKLL